MKTDVLFIHRQLAFAVSIKQALERTGSYDVHPFTSVEAAMEYLRSHPQDVALVDFMMPVYSGEEILERIRAVQPQLTVVATPTQSEEEFTRLGLNGMLLANFTAREFMPAVERALEGRRTGELPKGQGPGLLGRVQESGDQAEKRPPTSVIGYRSLDSILDEGPVLSESAPPAQGDDATLVGGFPAVSPLEAEPLPDAATLLDSLPAVPPADDLSFLDDIIGPPPPLPTPFPISDAEALSVVTDRLPDMDRFESGELPAIPPATPIGTEPLGLTTEPLSPLESDVPPVGDVFAGFDAESFGAEYGTRPLSEIDAEEAAARLGAPRSPEFETPDFAFPGFAAEDEAESQASAVVFGQPAPAFPPGFDLGDPYAAPAEDAPAEQPVDYMAFLDLQPSTPVASTDAPPWLTDGPVPDADAPSEDEVYAGLQALFGGDEPPPAPAPADFSFEDLPSEGEDDEDPFAGLLGEFAATEAESRQRSEFEELVASMSAQDQRTSLPARQQQYVDVSLTDDMGSLLEQIEQARTGGDYREDSGNSALDDEAVDLTAVLFVEDEEDTDTPVTGAKPLESPALASPDELAALFGAPRREPAAPAYDEFESLLAAGEDPAPAADDYVSLFAEEVAPVAPESSGEQDLETLLASFAPPPEPGVPSFDSYMGAETPPEPAAADFAAMFAAAPPGAPAPLPELDLESLFSSDEPAESEFNAMFGAAPVPETGPLANEPEAVEELDLFGGDWGAGDVLDVEQEIRFEETGTVSDLMTGVEEVTGSSGRTGMLTRLSGSLPPIAPDRPERPHFDTAPSSPPIDDTVTALLAEIEMQLAAAPPPAATELERVPDDTSDTPARRILETTSEAEQTDSSFSIDHLLDNIEAQLPPNQVKVQPLPSWLRPAAPPDTLPELSFSEDTMLHGPYEVAEDTLLHDAGPDVEPEPAFDWESATFDDTTLMGSAARAEQTVFTGDEETSWLEYIEPEPGAADETLATAVAVAGVIGVAAAVTTPPSESEWAAVEAEAEAAARAMQAEHIDDPYIAQLALSLTDVSLELTADAILLTRGADIAAFAGRMSRDELLELRQVIDDDWEAAANDARIRFLRLPESGKDVMLYSRRTVEDLTLSLVFDGAMPLRDIRQQGKRLMEALAAVPEAPVEIVLAAPSEAEAADEEEAPAIPRSPHAFVWLLRDPDGMLARPVAQAIVTGINQQMTEHGWRVREMRASEDHVYLLADSPDAQPPHMAVRELMRRSAQIAHVQNPALDARALWAEAYLVVTPGRSLEVDEIQQFIQFERML